MEEEKVGQTNEELEVIDFEIDEPEKKEVEEEYAEPVAEEVETNEEPVEEETPAQPQVKTDLFTSMQTFVSDITEPAPVEQTATFGEIMGKVNEEKSFGKKIKILLTEKRSKALFGLLFWVIFMVVVLGLLKGGMQIVEPTDDIEEKTETTSLASQTNYGYMTTLITPSETIVLDGKALNSKTIFKANGKTYYAENGAISKLENDELSESDLVLPISYNKLTPNSLSALLDRADLLNNTTDTEGNVLAQTYSVAADILIEHFYGQTVETEKKATISVKYEDKNVSYIEINMSDLTELEPSGKEVSEIATTFKNFGTVKAEDVTFGAKPISELENTK